MNTRDADTPTIPSQIIDRVHQKLDELVLVFNNHYPEIELPPINVTFENKGQSIGWAKIHQVQINLHGGLIMDHTDHMIDNVVGHELSHILVHQTNRHRTDLTTRIAPHGKEWQQFMNLFKIPPEAYHRIDVSKFRRKYPTVEYQCLCKSHIPVSPVINRSIQIYGSSYACGKCGSPITLKSPPKASHFIPDGPIRHETAFGKSQYLITRYDSIPKKEMIKLIASETGCSIPTARVYYGRVQKMLQE